MIFVPSDILPVEKLIFVLTVPLLVLVLWALTAFLRGEVETETEGAFSLMIEGCLEMYPYCSAPYICAAMFACTGRAGYACSRYSGWMNCSECETAMFNSV